MDQPLEAQLRATLNMIPAYTWYATPSGGLIFVNERNADYGGLPSDHPLRYRNGHLASMGLAYPLSPSGGS